MSVITNYIDVNSGNRDRTQFSSPFNFEVTMDGVVSRSALTAYDSVCESTPYYRVWTSLNRLSAASNTLSGTFQRGAIVIECNFDDTSSLVEKTTENFYAGLFITATGVSVTATRLITSSLYISTTGTTSTMRFVLETAFPDGIVATNGITITVNVSNNSPSTVLFIPNGANIDNAYVGQYLTMFESDAVNFTRETLQVSRYFSNTRMAILNGNFTGGLFDSTGNEIMIRKSINGTVTGVVDRLNSTTSVIRLDSVIPSATPGSFIRIIRVEASIPPTPPNLQTVDTRKILTSRTSLTGTFVSGTDIIFCEFSDATNLVEKTTEDFYINLTITVNSASGSISQDIGSSLYLSTSAGISTMKFILEAPFPDGIASGSTVTITFNTTQITISALSFTPASEAYDPYYEILPFSYDNYAPITFTGSANILSTMACYEIKLIHIVLPNFSVLENGYGGLFSSYPFLWVQLSSVTTSTVRDAIWSNARITTNYLFKVPLKDVNHPETSAFIKLDGAGMSQFIPFKPLDTFQFSVLLPDGTIPSIGTDYFSPAPPNPLQQVSATFEIRRRN